MQDYVTRSHITGLLQQKYSFADFLLYGSSVHFIFAVSVVQWFAVKHITFEQMLCASAIMLLVITLCSAFVVFIAFCVIEAIVCLPTRVLTRVNSLRLFNRFFVAITWGSAYLVLALPLSMFLQWVVNWLLS
jgi:hypothetical protein